MESQSSLLPGEGRPLRLESRTSRFLVQKDGGAGALSALGSERWRRLRPPPS